MCNHLLWLTFGGELPKMPNPLKFEIGEKYGKLTIIDYPYSKREGRSRPTRMIDCLCECGTYHTVQVSKIKSGLTKSCGCLSVETLINRVSLPDGMGFQNNLFSTYLKSAKDRGLEFEIDRFDFFNLVFQNCSYCNNQPNQAIKRYPDHKYNGLDRVDNGIGYTLGNVIPCCGICNRMKSSMSRDDFILHISNISKHIYRRTA